MEFQVYWPGWYRVIPWVHHTPADEDGPAEVWFGWSVFQFHKYTWRK